MKARVIIKLTIKEVDGLLKTIARNEKYGNKENFLLIKSDGKIIEAEQPSKYHKKLNSIWRFNSK